jgi:hypothetical protein
MKKQDGFIYLSIILSVVLILFILLLGFYQFIDGIYYKPVLEFESNIFQTTKNYYFPGETVYVKMKFKKNRDLQGVMKWALIDGRFYGYIERITSLPIGEYDFIYEIGKIPELSFVPDLNEDWYFSGCVSYEVNSINTVVYSLRTTKFKIMDKQ